MCPSAADSLKKGKAKTLRAQSGSLADKPWSLRKTLFFSNKKYLSKNNSVA